MFKVGDKIKLKDYSQYPDYKEHDGEIALVIQHYDWCGNTHVQWNNKETSTLFKSQNYAGAYKVKGGSMKLEKPKKLSWAVKYDKDVDPTEYFSSKKEAVARIEELSKDTSVSHISLLHIDTQWDVTITQSVALKKVI